jgi:hypothetical protein
MVLGLAAAGITGAAGLGVGAAIGGVVGFKIGAATERRKLSFSALSTAECEKYNVWLYDLLRQDFGYTDEDAAQIVAYAGFHAGANNPYLESTGISICNSFADRSKRGTATAQNHVVTQQFRQEMAPTLSVAIKDGVVTQNTDSGKLQFAATKRLSKSEVLMEFYRNTLAVLYLDLAQTINKTPNTQAENDQRLVDAQRKADNIMVFELEAYGTILKDRNSWLAKVVKQGVLHLDTARQKAVAPKIQVIKQHLQKEADKAQQATIEHQASGGGGAVSADLSAVEAGLQDEESAPLPAVIIKDALKADYLHKKATLEAEALAQQARTISGKVDSLVGDFASKTYSSATAADGYMCLEPQTVKEGKTFVKNTELRNSRQQTIDNLPFIQYVFEGRRYNPASHREEFVALPHTDLGAKELYKAHGDMRVRTKFTSPVKSRSAQYVEPQHAVAAAEVLAEIDLLSAMNEKFSDAYQYEVSDGQGAQSPMAHYLLLQQQAILNQIKAKFQYFVQTSLVLQMVNRALDKYKSKHPDFREAVRAKSVQVSGSDDVSSQEVDIFSFFDDVKAAGQSVLKNITQTKDLFMFSDMRQAIARLKQQTQLVDRLASEVTVDPDLTEGTPMGPDDPRAVALQLYATVASQPPGMSLPIKKELAGWSEELRGMVSSLGASEGATAVKAISRDNDGLIAAFTALLHSANTFVDRLNEAYRSLGPSQRSALIDTVKALGPYLSFNATSHQFSLNEQNFVSAYDYYAVLSSFSLISASLASSRSAAAGYVQKALKAYTTVVHDAKIPVYTQAQMQSLHAGKQAVYAHAEKLAAQQVADLQAELEDTREALAQKRNILERIEEQIKQGTGTEDESQSVQDALQALSEGHDRLEGELAAAQETATAASKALDNFKVDFTEHGRSMLATMDAKIKADQASIDRRQQVLTERSKEFGTDIQACQAQIDAASEKLTDSIRNLLKGFLDGEEGSEADLERSKSVLQSFAASDSDYRAMSVRDLIPLYIKHEVMSKINPLKKQVTSLLGTHERYIQAERESIRKEIEGLKEFQRSYINHVKVQGRLDAKLEEASLLQRGLADQLGLVHSRMDHIAKDLEHTKAAVAELEARVNTQFDSLAKTLQGGHVTAIDEEEHLANSESSDNLREVEMGRGPSRESKAGELTRCYKAIEVALRKLVINSKEAKVSRVVFQEHKDEAFAVMLRGMAVAQVHRSPLGGHNNTKSSLDLARKIMPKEPEYTPMSRRMGGAERNRAEAYNNKQKEKYSKRMESFVKFIGAYVTKIYDAYRKFESKAHPNKRVIMPKEVQLFTAAKDQLSDPDSRHRMTPEKLAKLLKRVAQMQHHVKYEGQSKLSFQGGGKSDFAWGLHAKGLFSAASAVQHDAQLGGGHAPRFHR